MQKNWSIPTPNIEIQNRLKKELGISAITAQLLINRGVLDSAEGRRFLSSTGGEDIHSPYLLKDMEKAVERISKAIDRGEKIMVWGDYDVDGISAVALLTLGLTHLGASVTYYLPNRLCEGYGLNKTGARQAKEKGITLLITVDCGISAIDEVNHLNELGIDVIVTDHHQPRKILSKAFAIINPLQEGCNYPYKFLAGVGLAFKLLHALILHKEGGRSCAKNISIESLPEQLQEFLDLVTLGTICDVVPITGENRSLVKYGLRSISPPKGPKRKGIFALIEAAGLDNKEINASHIGYILGPRINAGGRLGSPLDSLKLLLTSSRQEAARLSCTLNENNRKRQKIGSAALSEALERVEKEINFKYHRVIVLASSAWHLGVVGIVASRIADKFHRPTIIVALEEDLGKGSGRSIKNFHLFDALTRCADYLEEYGGHSSACGITLRKRDIPKFSQALNEVANEILKPEDLIPTLEIDCEIPVSSLNEGLIAEIEKLSPYGFANSRPLLCSRNLKLKSEPVVFGKNHLKMWVTDGKANCEVIGFRKGELYSLVSTGENFDIAYRPSINNWQGMSSIQLEIEDLRISQI